MIKCLVTDLDGTLFDGHGQTVFDLTSRNVDGLKKAKQHGLTIAVASGRIIGYAQKVMEIQPFDPYLICGFNGAIMKYNDEPFTYVDMERDTFKSLVAMVKTSAGVDAIQLQTLDSMRVFEDTDSALANKYKKEVKSIGIGKVCDVTIQQWFNHYPSSRIGKLSIYMHDLGSTNQLMHDLTIQFHNLNVTKSNQLLIEVMRKKANKGTFIDFIMDHTGWTKDEIATIGDNHNDLAMSQKVSTSFGIETGDQHFLDQITYPVQDVAQAIDMIIDMNQH